MRILPQNKKVCMHILHIATLILLLISYIKSKEKTKKALKIAYKKFKKIVPAFVTMLIVISILLALLPKEVIATLLENDNTALSVGLASLVGSITLMPGFIVYPLCGVLLKEGVSYMVLSAFTTTLMMVGIITIPIETTYFGKKVTITRNLIGFTIAIIVSISTGLFFKEIL